ncbi:DUF7544 domain-containing protein [Methanosarcina sp. UBA411]|jgi:hypothetical protein|uniref:DUF7544 domain-containing protein n=1 Tax=Methanosarcina sp. UBA411 TaxID=1915589 RepID=UPI0025E85F67|nr:hypothetical protein [Methanosarcina sp. UBA411]
MSWYGIDAVDRALSRTKKALFEPFNFWKWAKIAIIIFLLGGVSSFGSSSNYNVGSEDFKNNFPIIEPGQMPDLPFGTHDTAFSYIYPEPQLATLVVVIVLILLLALIFSYVSSVMEFVFVESLIRNEVKFWAYSRRFLKKGFNLLLVRLAIGLTLLALLGIAALPFAPRIVESPADFAWPVLLGGFFWIVGVIIVLILLAVAINSLLSLAIPLSIYQDKGILSAFGLIFAKFKKSWQEVLVYWLIRFVLGIGIAILAIFLFGLTALALGLIFVILDGILYFLFSSLVSEFFLWILLIPVIVIELILILGTVFFLNVPLAVFLKYHLLSFLEAWFKDAEIPFFDIPAQRPETGVDEPEPNL